MSKMRLESSAGSGSQRVFRHQGALVSGVSVCLGLLPLLGQVGLEWGVLMMSGRQSVQRYTNFSMVTCTDK